MHVCLTNILNGNFEFRWSPYATYHYSVLGDGLEGDLSVTGHVIDHQWYAGTLSEDYASLGIPYALRSVILQKLKQKEAL